MKRKSKAVSGNDWRKKAGEKAIGVTLPPELHAAAMRLAAGLGLRGRSEVGRQLFAWAASISDGGRDTERLKIILENLSNSH